MYLVAQLSEEHTVERVEAIVGQGELVYVAEHPRRELRYCVDVYDTFKEAQKASLRYIDRKLQRYAALRLVLSNETDPTGSQ